MFEEMGFYDLVKTIEAVEQSLADLDAKTPPLSIGDAMKYRHLKSRLNLLRAEKQNRENNLDDIPF